MHRTHLQRAIVTIAHCATDVHNSKDSQKPRQCDSDEKGGEDEAGANENVFHIVNGTDDGEAVWGVFRDKGNDRLGLLPRRNKGVSDRSGSLRARFGTRTIGRREQVEDGGGG